MWIQSIYGFALSDLTVEPAKDFHGAGRDTFFTAGTFLHIDETRFFVKCNFKVARFALDVFYLGIGDDLYVKVPAALHKFRRNNAHCAFICRKCLIKLYHSAAYRGRLIHQVHFYTGLCKVECCLHPADTSSHYEGRSYFFGSFFFFAHKNLLTQPEVQAAPL